jgi:hypothetical protein
LCDFGIDRFDLDQAGMNFPVVDALQPRKPLFGCFDRPFRRTRGADHDRALTTPEQPIVSCNLVKEANAIAGHRAASLLVLTRSLNPSRLTSV